MLWLQTEWVIIYLLYLSGILPLQRSVCMCWNVFSSGHGEYSYQQSSYGEQGYDRSFDESSQHYYEGGNSLSFCDVKPYIFLYLHNLSLSECVQPKVQHNNNWHVYLYLQVTPSTVSSRPSISRARASSSPSASSSTPLSKATAHSHRDMVRTTHTTY